MLKLVGGVIAAGSRAVARPLMQVGTIPVIRRIVITYRQVGIFPIVVVCDSGNEALRDDLSGQGVIFLENDHGDQPELFDSAKIGLAYLANKCERVVFTPVNTPMFSPMTLLRLMSVSALVVSPSYEGRGGHPIIVDSSIISGILSFDGLGGLKEALEKYRDDHIWVPVQDQGVLSSVHQKDELEQQAVKHNRAIIHPVLHMSLEGEVPFFDARSRLLLYLIEDTHNIRSCCVLSGISYSKAWETINRLEDHLGYPVVKRKHGGKGGGSTTLTECGHRFLWTYLEFESDIQRYAQRQFVQAFSDNGLI